MQPEAIVVAQLFSAQRSKLRKLVALANEAERAALPHYK